MAGGTSVGLITLDLIIKENLQSQLDKIQAKFKSGFEQPAQKMQDSFKNSFSTAKMVAVKSSDSIKKAVETATQKANDSVSKSGETIKNSFANATQTAETVVNKSNENIKQAFESTAKTAENSCKKAEQVAEETLDQRQKKYQENLKAEEEMLKKSAETQEKSTANSGKKSSNYGYDKDMMKYVDEYEEKAKKATQNVKDIVSKATKEMSSEIRERIGRFKISTDPVKRYQQEIDSLTGKLDGLQAKWQTLKHVQESFSGEDILSSEYEKVLADISAVEKQMISLQGTIDKTKAKINEGFEENTQSKNTFFDDLYQKYIDWLNQAKGIKKVLGTIGLPFVNTFKTIIASIKAFGATIKETMSNAVKYIKTVGDYIKNRLANPLYIVRDVFKLSSKVICSGFKMIDKAAKQTEKVVRKVFPVIKKLAVNALSAFGKKAIEPITSLKSKFEALQNPVKKFGKMVANSARRIFVMYGVLNVMKSIRSAIETTTKANDEFSNSLNQTKANCNVMFTSIMTSAMPAINAVMSAVERVTGQMAVFISEMLGTTYKKSLDVIKNSKQASKEAGQEAKKAQNYLASFDEMNVAQDNSDDSQNTQDNQDNSDDGIDYSKVNPNIELSDFAKQLKDSIKQQDWEGVGTLLASKVNEIVDKIDWNKTSQKLNKWITNFQTMMNGLVKGINWQNLGKSIAGGITTIFSAFRTWNDSFDDEGLGRSIGEMLNSAIYNIDFYDLGDALASQIRAWINGIYGFVTTFDFSAFGTAIGDIVNGWFNGVDWAKTATTLSESVKGALDTLYNFIKTIDWEQIGEDIATFLENIDWAGISDRIFGLIGLAIGSALALVKGFLKDKIEQGQEFFKKQFEKYDTGNIGFNIILGLLDGILQGLIGIGQWIIDHIFKPIWNGIKDAFGIHSPSKKMGEIGEFLIDGLFNAISDGIDKIKNIFKKMLDKIYEVFQNIGEWFKERFNDIKDAFMNAPTWFSDKFSDVWKKIKNAFSSLKKFFSDKWQDIKDVFGGIGDWFKDKFGGAWTKIKEVFGGVGDFFGGIWDTIKSKFSDIGTKVGDAIGSAFKTAINAVLSTVEGAINFIPNTINGVLQTVTDITGKELPYMPTVELPRLAKGGLATAPTLAMVGDNKNARVDPEVIAPLSKLENMLEGGSNSQVLAMLSEIISILKSQELTVTGEIDGRELWKAWTTMYNENAVRGGF